MKYLTNSLLLFVTVFLASCTSATTGMLLGMALTPTKSFKGEIEDDIYYSPENAFNVQVPHPPGNDTREWKYTKIREVKDSDVIGVSFGPALWDENIYHAILVRKPLPPEKEAYIKDLFQNKADQRSGKFKQKHFSKFQYNGKTTYYAIYSSGNYVTLLSLTDNKDSYYMIEADIVPDSEKDHYESIDQLIKREWSIYNIMHKSFTVTNASYKP